MPPQYNR